MTKTGIYKISFKSGSSCYIGSASNLDLRKRVHLSGLRKNNHHCEGLQNAFNKYGFEEFVFEIVELCKKQDLIAKEQNWIDALGVSNLYNSARIAGSTLGVTLSQATRDKMSESHKSRVVTEETKTSVSIGQLGKKKAWNKSGYVGVSYCKRQQKWVAQTRFKKKQYWIGYYETPEDASTAYQKFVKELKEKWVS